MLSTGGISHNFEFDDGDPWPHAIGVFDLTDLVWKDRYDAEAEDYEPPQMVKDWYNDGYGFVSPRRCDPRKGAYHFAGEWIRWPGATMR